MLAGWSQPCVCVGATILTLLGACRGSAFAQWSAGRTHADAVGWRNPKRPAETPPLSFDACPPLVTSERSMAERAGEPEVSAESCSQPVHPSWKAGLTLHLTIVPEIRSASAFCRRHSMIPHALEQNLASDRFGKNHTSQRGLWHCVRPSARARTVTRALMLRCGVPIRQSTSERRTYGRTPRRSRHGTPSCQP
jgi:hypothetical protein